MNYPVQPRITVVTALYNSSRFIERLHQSLTKQSNMEFEWIVIDDGSIDDSADLVLSLSAPWYGGTSVYRMPENTGGPLAYALGILKATTGIVTTVDHDDELTPSLMETVLQYWPEVERDHRSAGLIFQVMDPISGNTIGAKLPEGLITTFNKLQAYYPAVTDVAGFFKADIAKRYMSLSDMEMVALGGVPMRAMSGPYTVLHPVSLVSRMYHRDNNSSQTLSVRISDKFVFTYAKLINSLDIHALWQPVLWLRRMVAASRLSIIVHKSPVYHLRYISRPLPKVLSALMTPLGLLAYTLRKGSDRVVTYRKTDLAQLARLVPYGVSSHGKGGD